MQIYFFLFCQSNIKRLILGDIMKRTIQIFCFILWLSFPALEARGPQEGSRRCAEEQRESRGRHEKPSWFVAGTKVFYDGYEVDDASAQGFAVLRDGYAKDSWSVFYRGAKIDGASSMTFKVLGHGYARDAWNVYYDGRKIDGASAMNFTVLRAGYARDSWAVYYDGRKIDGAAPGSFKVRRDGYARDAWNTYYRGRKINQ